MFCTGNHIKNLFIYIFNFGKHFVLIIFLLLIFILFFAFESPTGKTFRENLIKTTEKSEIDFFL